MSRMPPAELLAMLMRYYDTGYLEGQLHVVRQVAWVMGQSMPTNLTGDCLFCGETVVESVKDGRLRLPQPHADDCLWRRPEAVGRP